MDTCNNYKIKLHKVLIYPRVLYSTLSYLPFSVAAGSLSLGIPRSK